MFLPISKIEALQRGWDELDIIFVTGDAYVDHPSFGVPLLARLLENEGYRVGIIPQPEWRSVDSFRALGRPRLFFAVSAGAMDSMVAHYTPARKLRHDDAYTPGNRHGSRPNRATIVYTSRLKEAYPGVPVVIGGIEASLRRLAHYDFWEDKVRRSILLDTKADLLVFGMGERPLLELAKRLRSGERFSDINNIRGTAFVGRGESAPATVIELPTFEEVSTSRERYAEAFRLAAHEINPSCARSLCQCHGDRYVICNPPSLPLNEAELDRIYHLPFMREPHPAHGQPIPAFEQIKLSITTHRGCFGGCAFCAITHHQGKTIQSRSKGSILQEIEALRRYPWFRGTLSDLGGPTANMYGLRCGNRVAEEGCRRPSCLFPAICKHLVTSDKGGVELLRSVRGGAGVRHAVVSSGIRYDLLELQPDYFTELLGHHVGGLLKVAPEQLLDRLTALMCKPGVAVFERFLTRFRAESRRLEKRHAVVPYLMSGHPGTTLNDMVETALLLKRLGLRVEQVQDFTPTPGTLSTCMYYTGIDPSSGRPLHVPRSDREKGLQKALLLHHLPEQHAAVMKALKECGRTDAASLLLATEQVRQRSSVTQEKRFKRKR